MRSCGRPARATATSISKPYSGLYCIGCEQFYTESELADGLCPEHLAAPELVEEENYFFRLSRYRTSCCRLIESDELRIVPQTRKNEVLSFIRVACRISASRAHALARAAGASRCRSIPSR